MISTRAAITKNHIPRIMSTNCTHIIISITATNGEVLPIGQGHGYIVKRQSIGNIDVTVAAKGHK